MIDILGLEVHGITGFWLYAGQSRTIKTNLIDYGILNALQIATNNYTAFFIQLMSWGAIFILVFCFYFYKGNKLTEGINQVTVKLLRDCC